MKYLAVLGRQPEISIAELEALGFEVEVADSHSGARPVSPSPRATGATPRLARLRIPRRHESTTYFNHLDINRLGGVLKLSKELEQKPLDYLAGLPDGKITIGISDYSHGASRKSAQTEALKLKKILVRHGRSVRVVENKDAMLSTATSLHNGLNGKNERKVELIKLGNEWYRVIGVQDIDAYAKRDQARPARDAKVGMLPPKLAQILINLCGPLEPSATILDPFCGTGVVLQEALLMGYRAYGTDIDERMVEYTTRNLEWLKKSDKYSIRRDPEPGKARSSARAPWRRERATRPENEYLQISLSNSQFKVVNGDATSFQWEQPIDAVACEGYLGQPMSQIPSEMKLKEQKQECGAIITGFLKNLAGQIKSGIPVVIAAPAWLRDNGEYERLDILDYIEDMGYNVNNKSREGLFYHREKQIVARDILILRKK